MHMIYNLGGAANSQSQTTASASASDSACNPNSVVEDATLEHSELEHNIESRWMSQI